MAFIHGALDKEIRLSFAQRIKGTLPEPYIPLITEGKEKDTPEFKYLSESKSPHILPSKNKRIRSKLTPAK
jgi:nuclear cap-binding protein subunit 1